MGLQRNAVTQCHDFTNVNNRDRMLEAVKMAGASEYKAELSWLVKDRKMVFQKFKLKKPYCVIIPGSSPQKPSKGGLLRNMLTCQIRFMNWGSHPT